MSDKAKGKGGKRPASSGASPKTNKPFVKSSGSGKPAATTSKPEYTPKPNEEMVTESLRM